MANILGFLGNIFGAGASAFGAGMSYKAAKETNATNLQMVRETNAQNMALAEYAYDKNLEQWKRENLYNSPKEQMSRLVEAGLNPNMIYGNSSAGVVSASSPTFNSPEMRAGHVENPMLGVNALLAQLGNLSSQTDLNLAKADKIRAETSNTEAKTVAQLTTNDFLRATEERKLSILGKTETEIIDRCEEIRQRVHEKSLTNTELNARIQAMYEYYGDNENSLIEAYKDIFYDKRNLQHWTSKEAEERAKNLKQATINLTKDAILKDDVHLINQFEIELNKIGLSKKDEVYWRLLFAGAKWGYNHIDEIQDFLFK